MHEYIHCVILKTLSMRLSMISIRSISIDFVELGQSIPEIYVMINKGSF